MTMRKMWIVAAVAALIVAVLTIWLWPRGNNDMPVVREPVVVSDTETTITIPNTSKDGKPLPVPVYESDPTDTAEVLNVSLVSGPCVIEPDGAIGAPDDYTTACLYNHAAGGQAVLSHSVRGPRTGVFDRLDEIPVGSEVSMDGHKYVVESVDIFPADAIPNYIWAKGRLSLITCTLQPKHDADPTAPWTHTTVVSLVDAP